MIPPHDDDLARSREEDRLLRLVADDARARTERQPERRSEAPTARAAAAHADWLAAEARLAASAPERRRDARRGRDFAAGVLARRALERLERGDRGSLVARRGAAPTERAAGHVLPAAVAVEEAAATGCAPLLELSVAAGAGRELWEQGCDRWVELPPELPRGRYLALGVRGDSMEPLLHAGDTLLVRLGAAAATNTVVVARLDDGGYVVKQVGRVTRRTIELRSLNAAYAPLRVRRTPDAVLGTVVLAWGRRSP